MALVVFQVLWVRSVVLLEEEVLMILQEEQVVFQLRWVRSVVLLVVVVPCLLLAVLEVLELSERKSFLATDLEAVVLLPFLVPNLVVEVVLHHQLPFSFERLGVLVVHYFLTFPCASSPSSFLS